MHPRPHTTEEATEYLARAEVAAIFQVAPSTVTRWAKEGKLVCVRTLGGHRRYAKESVIQLVQMLRKEETGVETIRLEIPRLYGDHHTIAVRQALAQLAGIRQVWASAALHEVQVSFDPAATGPAAIEAQLAKAGYPAHDGSEAGPASAMHKDPAWAASSLRMTQTYPTGAKA